MALPGRQADETDAALVEAFLRANPGWLADHPELYRVLVPPNRVHGEALADHMAAMVRAERVHAAAMAARADSVLAAGRAAAGLAQRVQAAVLALIAPPACAPRRLSPALVCSPPGRSPGCWTGAMSLFASIPTMRCCCTPRRRASPGMTRWCA